MLWEQNIILREQNINKNLSHGLNQPPYKKEEINLELSLYLWDKINKMIHAKRLHDRIISLKG